MLANIVISPETQLFVPIGALCTLVLALIATTWRLANRMRDLSDAVRNSWTFRDQERWALELERENRSRGYHLYVPDVKRAPGEQRSE